MIKQVFKDEHEQFCYSLGFQDGILAVQEWLKKDGWDLVKEMRKGDLCFYPKEINIHTRLIKEIGKLKE